VAASVAAAWQRKAAKGNVNHGSGISISPNQ